MRRKPPELKSLAGTARPDRDTANVASLLPRMDVVPAPPDWLTLPAAVAEWNRVAPLLVSVGILKATMTSTLGHLCQLHGRLLSNYAHGLEPKAALVAQYIRLSSLFGLTAIDATRLPRPVESKRNPFRDFKDGADA
ncbi:MAG: hypothetical protein IT483_15690 [Gammaproteobacteria bacterium]|nr:hypothetical protein [Gammaproteobacteria bacterium]